jgi:hypothetical protein
MPNEEPSAPTSGPRPSTPDSRPLPTAWQPITPRGIAAFSRARIGRLFVVQFIAAALTAGVVAWFLSIAWFPIVLQAIRQLPETGVIANRQLAIPRNSPLPLAGNRFIAFFADTNRMSDTAVASDVRVGFHRDEFAICSLFGCLRLRYPAGAPVPLNRTELEPWWGAWEPMFLALALLGVVALLFLSWLVLATLYCPGVWMFAYFKDRQLTLAASWKLAGASLLPGALLAALGIVLYGLGLLNLLRFLLLWVMHLMVGWAYLFGSALALARVSAAVRATRNPFTDSSAQPKSGEKNPFASTSAKSGEEPMKPQA